MEIWVTNKIDPSAVSWSKFLNVNITTLVGFPVDFKAGSFFIDEEEKVVVVFSRWYKKASNYQTAHVIGEVGYIKSVTLEDVPGLLKCHPQFSSYVPSLVQLQINQPGNDYDVSAVAVVN
ncbi:F-box associated domain type 1 [Arabidopsis suecica]|uniref:F-box associated domain type 1 n=1 Tax=Arabidopsis suecica TaxID=45249 RepID=A0A8T2B488_ARASU|nr:F-box associated domain type 1 [Arabidopsis suecica]